MSTLPSITFVKGQGGLGRPLPGNDHISGLCIYTANGNLPTGFASTNNSTRIKKLLALSDAETLGILGDYSDATAAIATYLFTAVGTNGDTVELKVADIDLLGVARVLSLGVYVKLSGDSSVSLLGASYAAVINAGTVNHGYSAVNTAGSLAIKAPKRMGILLNTGTILSATIVGGIAGTITQFSAGTVGVASKLSVWHYHIAEFFRIQPQGVLWVGFFAIPTPYVFTEVTTMQNYAGGTIRQIGVWKDYASAFATADLTALDVVCKINDGNHKPLSSLYAADLSGTADISTLTDLSTLTANKASACIAQDGGGLGNYLWLTTGKSITALGTMLGAVSLSKVSEDIGAVAKFNMSNGTECEVLAFANGQYFTDIAITDNLLESLNAYRYIFLKKFVGRSGSYWNDDHTAIIVSSDYAHIDDNRVIDKACRNLYTEYLDSLNATIQLNADGTLSETTVAYLEKEGDDALDQMVRDGELSAKAVVINPAQNILATSILVVGVTLVKEGIARYIQVPIGFKPKIS